MGSFGGLGLSSTKLVGQQGPMRLVYGLEARLPWPFTRRTCHFAVEAVDCMAQSDAEHKQIAILMDSKQASQICPDAAELQSGRRSVDAVIKESGLILTPTSEGTQVQMLLNVDPRMMVQDWLVATTTMQLCHMIFSRFQQASTWARSPEYLERSCDPNNAFYRYLRHRMAEMLPSQSKLVPPVKAE